MTYVAINDLIYVIKSKYKLILIYLLYCLSIYIALPRNADVLYFYADSILGFNIDIVQHIEVITPFTFSILNYGILIYLAISIFFKDTKNFDNIFQRMTFNSWLNSKILVAFICTIVINTMLYLGVHLKYPDINLNYLFVLVKSFVTTIMIIYVYLEIILYKKNKSLFTIVSLLIMSLYFIKLDLLKINIIILGIIFIMAILIINIFGDHTSFSDLEG